MDKKNNNINVDEFVEIHNSFLESKTSDLFFKKEKLKNIIESGKRTYRSIKLTKLISAYSFMIIVFTIFSFMIINHFESKQTKYEKEVMNLSIFLRESPGAILLTQNDEVMK